MSPVTASSQDTLVHSYLLLRRAIGLIGIGLPVVLIIGKLVIDGGGLLSSVSDYYYSDMRDVLVGSMCAIGVFLLSYRGYGPIDDLAGDLAAVTAIGVALFPTTPDDHPTRTDQIVGGLHIVFAATFFLTLAFFCLVLFRKTDQTPPTRRKTHRNRVYLASGVIILACLALIVLSGRLIHADTGSLHPVLWLESTATLAYGVAWMTKGETILRDLSPAPEHPPLPATAHVQT
ncbi:MAG TPA: DUF998 domain-containing protein [Pseudonocardiaceae bacterium]